MAIPRSPLPNGWAESLDAGTGRVYYYHKASRKSQFEFPQPSQGDPPGESAIDSFVRTVSLGKLGKGKKKQEPRSLVLSASALIKEVKLCVCPPQHAGLDSLCERLHRRELDPDAAVAALVELVGTSLAQQASLSITNAQQGILPHGWIEYQTAAPESHPYYYNVHTKVTTWNKPTSSVPPPPPREQDDDTPDSVRIEVAIETHDVAMTGFI